MAPRSLVGTKSHASPDCRSGLTTARRPKPAAESETVARRVRVLIVQDHPLLASALARVLEGEPDLAVSGVSSSGAAALESAAQDRPDVVLMDFRLPDTTGPEAARMIMRALASRDRLPQRRRVGGSFAPSRSAEAWSRSLLVMASWRPLAQAAASRIMWTAPWQLRSA